MNEIKEKLNKWRDIPYGWRGRLSTVKTSVLPNSIYRVNAITIKSPASYFMGYWQTDSKVYMEKQKSQNSQHNTEMNPLYFTFIYAFPQRDSI